MSLACISHAISGHSERSVESGKSPTRLHVKFASLVGKKFERLTSFLASLGMTRDAWDICRLGMGFLLLFASTSYAQQRIPHIGYVYPAGGRQGTTFQITIGGQNLDETVDILTTGSDIQTRLIEQYKPLNRKQANDLKEKLGQLKMMKQDNAVLKEIVAIRKQLARFVPRQPNPAIAETATFEVTIDPGAQPGNRELRLQTETGLSNPLLFQIGSMAEVVKTKKDESETDPKKPKRNAELKAVEPSDAKITLPVVVNGQILQGGVDRYHFHAMAGQHLVVAVSARALIPYLPDAVPGWFQAEVALYNEKGSELIYSDRYQFHPDPLLLYVIPSTGEYLLEIRDALYRGRDDFVYRMAIGELPFLESLFPLGGETGKQIAVELRGWNLPVQTLSIDLKNYPLGTSQVWTGANGMISAMPFAVDALPEINEKEPNHAIVEAQRVKLPVIINGRIDKPGKWDAFRFEGRAGDKIVAEVMARRLGSPLDSVLKLTGSTGKQLAFNDDFEDKGAGLETHHADSYLACTLPSDGAYYIHIGDAQQNGGWAYGYRLRISPPQPDFALRTVPSSLNGRIGSNVALTVYVLRRDGFDGPVKVRLRDAPQGFKLSGSGVPANQEQAQLTLFVPFRDFSEPISLHLEGSGTVQGREIVRPVIPSDDMMQAFAYHHLVPAGELLLKALPRPLPPLAMQIVTPTPLKMQAGGSARIRVSHAKLPDRLEAGVMQFEMNDPPDGLSIMSVAPVENDMEIVLQAGTSALPGMSGNLVIKAFGVRLVERPKKGTITRRVPLGTLPAIPFQIEGVSPSPTPEPAK